MGLEERVVRDVIIEQLGVEDSQVVPSARFVEDLGADSLDCVELLMAVEETFEFDMPDEDAETLLTVGALVEYLKGHGHIHDME